MRNRSELLERINTGQVASILIIGGGINGVGVFRDLAAQGIPSLLVERGDFSSGTSAAPSRLIHGGLRYLETGETSLVRESLVERNLLLRNARHVVHPQPVWIPLRNWFAGSLSAVLRFLRLKKTPGRKGAIPVALGLRVYDLFGRAYQQMPNHRILRAARAREEVPVLAPDVKVVAEYYDARISHPERLVLELVADAEADCPDAMAIPYMEAGPASGGKITLRDKIEDAEVTIEPDLVINASGAWVDSVHGDLGISGRLMGGTRGTHLVMRNPQLVSNLGGRMLYFETKDFRACLALPLDDRHVYVGTTDVRTDDPDDGTYTEEEIDYILDVLRPVLPSVEWRREDSVFTMAGIRPLPFQDDRVRASGAISRDHRIESYERTEERPFELLSLIGGKWTTYRAFAEQVADKVLARLDRNREASTKDMPIGGARNLPETPDDRRSWAEDLAERTGLTAERCKVLMSRYGTGARAIAEAEEQQMSQFETLEDYTPTEIELICRNERVNRLQDIVLRRTLMAFEGRTSRAALEEVADVAARVLDWDATERSAQLSETIGVLEDRHRVEVK